MAIYSMIHPIARSSSSHGGVELQARLHRRNGRLSVARWFPVPATSAVNHLSPFSTV